MVTFWAAARSTLAFVDQPREPAIQEYELANAERQFRFAAPQQFVAGLPAMRRILESDAFKKSNPRFAAVTVTDMKSAWDDVLPDDLVPFCTQAQPNHIDYYCFYRTTDNKPQIVVFADHAIVYDWPDMNAFLRWLESLSTP
jgi:hypothetical protein